ncbi:trans-sulfuration enzyme family protein [Tundrisphaera lichenicola]|uniref:trans-sulfuration enzyme family protein n=1 Tax=Tundrisphaera lichenicola TaxID=2029860 RepID=UPI003EBC554E
MTEPSETDPSSLCARPARVAPSATPPLSPPLQLSSVYEFDNLDRIDAIYQGRESGFVYARDGHLNAAQLASKMAALEGGEAALVCGSGMAAESALLLTLLEQGDRVALSEGLYGRTLVLVARELARFGIGYDLFDGTRPESLREVLTPQTRVVFVETLSNPLLRLADIEGLAAITRPAGVILAVDHTFAPLLCQPLKLGADLVTHSATKAIGGHSDVTLGLLIGPKHLIDRASSVASTFGLTGNPFDAWMALRGLSTLAVRTDRSCASASELALRLEGHPEVERVHYPGLTSHPDHALAGRVLTGGFGAIVSFDLGSRERADALIRSLHHIPYAPSLGDVSTTLSHPTTSSHRSQTPEQWAGQGITPGLIRLSVGVESVNDLWADLGQALDRVREIQLAD